MAFGQKCHATPNPGALPLSLPTSFVVAKRRQRVAAGVSPQIMMVQTVPSREAAAAGR